MNPLPCFRTAISTFASAAARKMRCRMVIGFSLLSSDTWKTWSGPVIWPIIRLNWRCCCSRSRAAGLNSDFGRFLLSISEGSAFLTLTIATSLPGLSLEMWLMACFDYGIYAVCAK